MSGFSSLSIMEKASTFLGFEENKQILHEHLLFMKSGTVKRYSIIDGIECIETVHTIRGKNIKAITITEPKRMFICLGDEDVTNMSKVIA